MKQVVRSKKITGRDYFVFQKEGYSAREHNEEMFKINNAVYGKADFPGTELKS